MFCARKINVFSLLLLTVTSIWGRDLTFNTDRREERNPIDSSTGLAVLGYLVGGGAISLAAQKCMPIDKSSEQGILYRLTQNTLVTPHDVSAIAKISATSLTLAAFCAPNVAKQFREFAVRAPIAGAVYALSKSQFVQELYGHVPLFGEALKAPTSDMKKKYPLAGEMTSGVVAIATYKALDPAISFLCKRAYKWWHGVYNESADIQVSSEDYKKVL